MKNNENFIFLLWAKAFYDEKRPEGLASKMQIKSQIYYRY